MLQKEKEARRRKSGIILVLLPYLVGSSEIAILKFLAKNLSTRAAFKFHSFLLPFFLGLAYVGEIRGLLSYII